MGTRGPHHLRVQDLDGTTTILTEGLSTLSEDAARLTRVGLGHPEGFLEAFANFYRDLANDLRARRDGLAGIRFVEAVAASHHNDAAWVTPVSSDQKAGV